MHSGLEPTPQPLDELNTARERKREGRPVWDWFERRVRNHNQSMRGIPSVPFQEEAAADALEQKLSRAESTNRPRVLYVHIPFCQKICTFCAFIRKPLGPLVTEYVESLLQAIDRMAQTPWAAEKPFQAVFIGGGTPTSLPARQLIRILERIENSFPLESGCEFTVESRFMGMDEAYLAALSGTLVNRLSFGVQSFNTGVRNALGRETSREDMLALLRSALRKQFRSISIDLIYNLPDQDHDIWQSDLETLRESGVSGSSIYPLIPFPDSTLMKQIEKGVAAPLGGIDQEYTYHQATCAFWKRYQDWTRMSPFHFGQAGMETCVYNESRLGMTDILGIGCGAGGNINGLSYMNPMKPDAYCTTIAEERLPVQFAAKKPAEASEAMNAYRLLTPGGVTQAALHDVEPALAPVTEALLELELLCDHTGSLTLTDSGCFWAYTITSMISRILGASLSAREGVPSE